MAELRRLVVVPPGTEKLHIVLRQAGLRSSPVHDAESAAAAPAAPPRLPAPGHGRHGAAVYRGARRIAVAHETLRPGDRCPHCSKGKVYVQRDPSPLIRFVGQPPLAATVYDLERLRCNLCGDMFTAAPPEGVGPEKYDATAASMMVLLKYGNGVPFNRVEGVQAAQGTVLHNDDTRMKILALTPTARRDEPVSPERTGIFTSGVVARGVGHQIALFMTGWKHAGEKSRRGAPAPCPGARAPDPGL
jgi:transposase